MGNRCAQCGQERTSIFTTDLSAKAQGVDAKLLRFPYRSCAQDHEKVYVYPDFGSELAEFIFGGAIPETKKGRGLFSRRESCAMCGSELAPDPPEKREFHAEPKLRDAPPFELVLRMPAIVCPNCGTAQVRTSSFGKGVNPLDAILAAFQKGAVNPT